MQKYRKVICGPDKNTDNQQAYEMKVLPLKKRKYVCALAGIKQGAHITSQLGLALKSHAGLSWVQRDKINAIICNSNLQLNEGR